MKRTCHVCFLPTCQYNKTVPQPDWLRFHRFPLGDKQKLAKWLSSLKITEDRLKKHSLLCSLHFSSASYMNPSDRNSRLRHDAIPALNVLGEINLPGQPNASDVEPTISDTIAEKSYDLNNCAVANPTKKIRIDPCLGQQNMDESEDPELPDLQPIFNASEFAFRALAFFAGYVIGMTSNNLTLPCQFEYVDVTPRVRGSISRTIILPQRRSMKHPREKDQVELRKKLHHEKLS